MCLESLGIGGSSAKTDRAETLKSYGMTEAAFGKLGDLSTQFGKSGAKLSASGALSTGDAAKYYSNILSGDPAAVMSAAAPEVNALTGQAATQRKQIASEGTSRAGGVNAAMQGISSDVRGQVGNIISAKRGEAAKGMERIGAEQTSEGLAAQGLGLQSELGAGQLALGLGQLSTQSRQVSQQIHDQAVQMWAQIAADALAGLA